MKVLFCSPYLDVHNIIRGGINTWGRYIMTYYENYVKDQVEIVPVSLDRSVFAVATSSVFQRIIKGCRDQMRPLCQAISLMNSEKPDVLHLCTSAGLGLIRDFVLTWAAKQRGIRSVVHLHFGRIPSLAQQRNLEWKVLYKILKMWHTDVILTLISTYTMPRFKVNTL